MSLAQTQEERPAPVTSWVPPGAVPATEPKAVPATSAKLVVALPAGARLFIDDRPVPVGAGETTFCTPPMQQDATYYYRFRAELVRGGETICEGALVVLRPGQESWVSFPQLQIAAIAPRTPSVAAYCPAACATLGAPVQDQEAKVDGDPVRPVLLGVEASLPRQAARLVVALPPGARLFIDGRQVRARAGETIFHTPPLEVGAAYGYQVCAELFYGGQAFLREMMAVVRAGEEARVSFVSPQTPPAAPLRWNGGAR
jgi:uncharacterized protein (TIGR03000 family)